LTAGGRKKKEERRKKLRVFVTRVAGHLPSRHYALSQTPTAFGTSPKCDEER
jgi:hypothetical protein